MKELLTKGSFTLDSFTYCLRRSVKFRSYGSFFFYKVVRMEDLISSEPEAMPVSSPTARMKSSVLSSDMIFFSYLLNFQQRYLSCDVSQSK